MARIDSPFERLTEYERAVCYYTLPRVVHPLALGLMGVYTVCLFEAVGALVYGVVSEQDRIRTFGAGAMAAVVVMGVITFTLRALLNEVRQRWALEGARRLATAEARTAANDSETFPESEIPDPFAGHLLIRRPMPAPSDLYACTDNEGNVFYFVEPGAHGDAWRVKDAQENDVVRIELEARVTSFSMGGLPSRLAVYRGSDEIAKTRRRFSLASLRVKVRCLRPKVTGYSMIGDGLYHEGVLVGRMYEFHQSLYLDIEKEAFHDALLALFVTRS